MCKIMVISNQYSSPIHFIEKEEKYLDHLP